MDDIYFGLLRLKNVTKITFTGIKYSKEDVGMDYILKCIALIQNKVIEVRHAE
jgi:hypothetical protein